MLGAAGLATMGGDYTKTLSLTGYWRANYTGAPWVGTTTAGSSGSNLVTTSHDPIVGTAVNGFTPATLGNTGLSSSPKILSDFVSLAQGSGFALFKFGGTQNLFSDYNGALGSTTPTLRVDTSGTKTNSCSIRVIKTGGAPVDVACTTAPIVGTWYLVQWTYLKNDNVRIRLNNDSFAAAAIDADTNILTHTVDLGISDAGSFPGSAATDVLEVGISNTIITDAQFNNVRAYCNSKYGLNV